MAEEKAVPTEEDEAVEPLAEAEAVPSAVDMAMMDVEAVCSI